MKSFFELKNALLAQARDKPVAERFQTRALGNDPPPIICFEIDGTRHVLDFSQDKPDAESLATPNLTVRCSWQTLRAVWTRQVPALDAIQNGAMEVEGSLRIGHALQRYFTDEASS